LKDFVDLIYLAKACYFKELFKIIEIFHPFLAQGYSSRNVTTFCALVLLGAFKKLF
jgi:hypothetical protein